MKLYILSTSNRRGAPALQLTPHDTIAEPFEVATYKTADAWRQKKLPGDDVFAWGYHDMVTIITIPSNVSSNDLYKAGEILFAQCEKFIPVGESRKVMFYQEFIDSGIQSAIALIKVMLADGKIPENYIRVMGEQIIDPNVAVPAPRDLHMYLLSPEQIAKSKIKSVKMLKNITSIGPVEIQTILSDLYEEEQRSISSWDNEESPAMRYTLKIDEWVAIPKRLALATNMIESHMNMLHRLLHRPEVSLSGMVLIAFEFDDQKKPVPIEAVKLSKNHTLTIEGCTLQKGKQNA